MKYYVTRNWIFGEVTCDPIEVERETAECVWVNGSRRSKNSNWPIFKTKAEVKQYHIDRINAEIKLLHLKIETFKTDLEMVEKFETKEI